MGKVERIIGWILAGLGVLQALALIPSIPYIYFAAQGLVSVLSGDFGYWAIRDSVVTVLAASFFIVGAGYFAAGIGRLAARSCRLVLWGFSALLHLSVPIFHLVDPRAVVLPFILARLFLGYFLLISSLSGCAFYLAWCEPEGADSSKKQAT